MTLNLEFISFTVEKRFAMSIIRVREPSGREYDIDLQLVSIDEIPFDDLKTGYDLLVSSRTCPKSSFNINQQPSTGSTGSQSSQPPTDPQLAIDFTRLAEFNLPARVALLEQQVMLLGTLINIHPEGKRHDD